MWNKIIGKVAAAGPINWNEGPSTTGYECVANGDVATIQGVTCLIYNIGTVVFTILGFGGLIMLTVSGLRYMLSGGTAQAVDKARRSVVGVVVGLVLALSSFLIVALISRFTGVEIGVLEFNN
jgi:hypothetical protein